MNTFADLGVLPVFTSLLAQRHITQPTAIQCLVIPWLLEGKCALFRSPTGTGKTFSYLIPALQRLLAEPADAVNRKAGPAVLVCTPTLELCSQIKNEADFLLDGQGKVSLLIGTGDLNRQIDSLKKNKPLVAVGNPGRLLLLAKMGKLKFTSLRFLALDEADRLTEKECRHEMTEFSQIIIDRTKDNPFSLVVAANSATVSVKTKKFLHPLLEKTELLETGEHEILRERIRHWAIFCESRKKTQTLIAFIAAAQPKKTLVFTSRSFDAGKIVSVLQRHAIDAAGLYSGTNKVERKQAIDHFRSGKAAVLVSSDLAARGLDIPGISHVIALDVNENSDTYIHRAGRTGRAGKRGIMVSIGDAVDMRRLAALEKKLGIRIQPKELYRGKVLDPQ